MIYKQENPMLTETTSPSLEGYDDNSAPEISTLPHIKKREVLTFKHSIDIYLKDSNAYGNTYFARNFEWQGVCRERWLQQCIAADLMQPQGVLITKNANTDYVRETFPFQTVECELNTLQVKNCSVILLFKFNVAGNLVCKGRQQIVFAAHDKKMQRWPALVMENLRKYELFEDGLTPLSRH
jgi:enediyne core biosynthesis thioesterase